MSEPTVLYEWTFPPDRGCRIIEIEPGIVIGQERESHDAPWRDEPCPSGWKHELIALAQETSDWRSDAAMAVLETCGDEEHCTCVGPLRKLARDLGMDKAALVLTLEVETDLRRKAENDLAHEKALHAHEIEKAKLEAKIETWDGVACWCPYNSGPGVCSRCEQLQKLRAALTNWPAPPALES